CFHDFIREGETGFIFNHRAADPADALREKIENVMVDKPLLARVAGAGYRESAEYSLTRVADQFLDDFNSLVRNSDAAPTDRYSNASFRLRIALPARNPAGLRSLARRLYLYCSV